MDKNQIKLQTMAQNLSRVENPDIGLISGKMGAVIFFFHYARYTGEKSCVDTAMKLLDEIQQQLSVSTKKSYRQGIAGIGVAIDYLIENEFIAADENILDGLDHCMHTAINEDVVDYSLYDGLIGYGWYWLIRTNRNHAGSMFSKILFLIKRNMDQMSITERFDVYNFLFELSCMSVYGEKLLHYLHYFRNNYLRCEAHVSYPRLFNSPAGELARTHLLKKYWQFDWYVPSNLIMSGKGSDAWDGLYLLSALSPNEKAWIGLL